MKRASITRGTDYAVSVKVNRYDKSNSIVRGTVVGFPDNYVEVSIPGETTHRRIVPAMVQSTWADHEAAVAAAKAKREREYERQAAAWEAKRREERERYEQRILPAFKGLPTVGHVSQANLPVPGGDPDLADYIADTMLDGGSTTVTLREADLRGIADRILELQAIVQQNAMVANDPPEAGFTALTRMHVIEQELAKKLKES